MLKLNGTEKKIWGTLLAGVLSFSAYYVVTEEDRATQACVKNFFKENGHGRPNQVLAYCRAVAYIEVNSLK